MLLKDTSCDLDCIKEKLAVLKGSEIKLFNANAATLLDSLKCGANGYMGVMANFHPALYKWLNDHWMIDFVTVYSKDDIQFTFKNGTEIRM